MTPLRLVLGSADLSDDAQTQRLLDEFYDAGGRALDVANVYGDGESERAIGRWLRERGRRDGVVLYAKGCHPPHCEPTLVRQEVERALNNLEVERLDVFLLHRDDPAIPMDAWARALASELDRGTVLSVGVANWTLERFDALRMYLHGDRVAAFSSHFSLAEMTEPPWPGCLATDARTARDLIAAGVTVLAWASLAAGYLAGNSRREPPADTSWQTPANERRRARAGELARELGVTSATVAIAYVLAHEGVRPVVGTRSSKHLADAIAAETIHLSTEQILWLEDGTRT